MLSPPVAAFIINLVEAVAGGSASPASQSMLAADWKRSVASAPPLLAVTGQGAVGDGELVLIHDVQAYRIAGCQNGWGGLAFLSKGLARLGWLALRPLLREAPPGPVFRRPRGRVASESLELGGGMLSGDPRERRPPSCVVRSTREGRPEAWQC